MKPILKPIFIQLAKILMPISQLAEPFVCDQGGGTPLVSDLDQVAEEEAFQPGRWSPGGWRRCGGRDNFSHQEGFQFDAARSNSAATPPLYCLGEAEGSSVDTSERL